MNSLLRIRIVTLNFYPHLLEDALFFILFFLPRRKRGREERGRERERKNERERREREKKKEEEKEERERSSSMIFCPSKILNNYF